MKVRELIELLNSCDPEEEVYYVHERRDYIGTQDVIPVNKVDMKAVIMDDLNGPFVLQRVAEEDDVLSTLLVVS